MNYDYARSAWQTSSEPVTGPRFIWRDISQIVIHYPGNPETWRVPQDIRTHLQRMQTVYLRSRGYSYGYNAVVVSQAGHPLDGSSWEVRGDTYRSAANAGVNHVSYAIQVLQRSNDQPTVNAVDGVRRLVAQALTQRPNLRIVGHNTSGSTTRTACPGIGLDTAVRDGTFYPVSPIPSGDDMIAIYKPVFKGANANTPWVAVFQSGAVRRAVNADVVLAQRLSIPIVDQDSKEQHDYLLSIFP
jgi:hypothetical protein